MMRLLTVITVVVQSAVDIIVCHATRFLLAASVHCRIFCEFL